MNFKKWQYKVHANQRRLQSEFCICIRSGFDYEYDRSNRLTKATNGEKVFEVVNTYDNDGNILTLERNGSTGDQPTHT